MKHPLIFAAVTVVLLLPGRTWAHALGAQWHIKGEKVVLEAYFSDGTPAQGAQVRVFKEADRKAYVDDDSTPDQLILEFKTDEKGERSFSRPEPGKYRIVVDAGGGHRKELFMVITSRPAKIPGIVLLIGSPSLGGMESLSVGPILALDYTEFTGATHSDGPSKEEFTAYPWGWVAIVLMGAILIALVFWILRNATTGT